MVLDILPTTDLLYDDIRDTLNANGGSVTNKVESAFKKEANINIWAKYKPVIFNLDFPSSSSEWWKALDKNCGILIKHSGDMKAIATMFDNNDIGWTHIPPRGDSTSPYRNQDFLLYNSKAKAPISYYCEKDVVVRLGDYYYATITTFARFATPTELNFSDIKTDFNYGSGTPRAHLGLWYAGFLILVPDLASYKIITTDKNLLTAATDAPITIKALVYASESGKTLLYPILSSMPYIKLSNTNLGGLLMPMPGAKREEINVVYSDNFRWKAEESLSRWSEPVKDNYEFSVAIHYVLFGEKNRYINGRWQYIAWYLNSADEPKDIPYSYGGYNFTPTDKYGDPSPVGKTVENFYQTPKFPSPGVIHINDKNGEHVKKVILQYIPDSGKVDPAINITFNIQEI